MVKFRQFWLLVWKNYVLQKRRPIGTFFEIVLPTLFILLLAFIKASPSLKAEKKCEDRSCTYPPFRPNYGILPLKNWTGNTEIPFFPEVSILWETPPIDLNRPKPKKLAYTPNTLLAETIMSRARDIILNQTGSVEFGIPVIDSLLGFENESAMADFLVMKANEKQSLGKNNYSDYSDYVGGVVFNFENTLPSNIEYSIRLDSRPRLCDFDPQAASGVGGDPALYCTWLTQLVYPLTPLQGPRDEKWKDGGQPGYHRESFSVIQWAVDMALIMEASDDVSLDDLPDVYLRRYPYPEYLDDRFVYAIQNGLPLLLMLAYIYTALSIVKALVQEKERRLKESMKMMGLANWVHWSAWFTKCFLFLLITVAIITIIFKVGKVLTESDISVIFVFLLLYAIATISFCFCVSVFFKRAVWGAAGGGLLWMFTYVPYFFLQQNYLSLTLADKLGPSIFINTNMAFGAQLIGTFEGTGVGLQWSNIGQPPTVDDDLTFAMILAMFVGDTIIYLLITWYVEAVFPGEYGIPLKWYFPVLPSYWCGSYLSKRSTETNVDETTPLLSRRHVFEREPDGLAAGVKIVDIRKVFNGGKTSEKVAVDGVSLNMYEGQISALLGHNGAGKTTLMSMLTGLFPPSSGRASVNDFDIRSNIDDVRESLGLCPQHDVLFDALTVEEHLWFFARLKGCESDAVQREIDDMVRTLQIEDRRRFQTRMLSGGMKRKLSVGIALIAGSKIVMLDEPTSGMDPSARRATWDLLAENRKGRTILLTTHFMEEADFLGDRIAIMANGKVRCCGTSLFLKSKYGVGYHMTIVKDPERCSVPVLTGVVQSHVPSAGLESQHGREVTYLLPREATAQFASMFTELEKRKTDLGIASYGASLTTMEEVFIKVGEEADSEEEKQNGGGAVVVDDDSPTSSEDAALIESGSMQDYLGGKMRLNAGLTLALQQFYAMFMKRFLYCRRNKMALITQFMLPVGFTLLGLILSKTLPSPGDSPPMTLTTAQYGTNNVPFGNFTSTGEDDVTANLTRYYASQFAGGKTTPIPVRGEDIESFILATADSRGPSFNTEYLVAASFNASDDEINATAWFNNQAFHAIGATLTAMDNAVMQTWSNGEHTITTTNHPLPRTLRQIADDLNIPVVGFTVAFELLFGMAFLTSTFVRLVVEEKENKAKHVQFVSGVTPLSYWLSAFAWDMINYMVPSFVVLILFAAFNVSAFVDGGRLGIVLLQLFLYGWSIIPLMYLLGFLFSKPSTAFILLTLFNIITGELAILVIQILMVPQLGLENIAKTLKWIFLVLPNYCLGQGLIDMYTNHGNIEACAAAEQLCRELNITFQTNYMSWENGGQGRYSVFMACEGLLLIGVVVLIDAGIAEKVWYKLSGVKRRLSSRIETDVTATDEDVVAEQKRVRELASQQKSSFRSDDSDLLLVDDLWKIYSRGCCGGDSVTAVAGVGLGVQRGECFGLLGVNGAGKSTTFNILTGDLMATRGTAYLDSYDIQNDMQEVRQRIGYCPQYDAQISLLTGRELLTMFARLRGVPERKIPRKVNLLMKSLLLMPYADKLSGTYSGGNKRKLCTAISMIGDPPVVFLDEPTTGMDPVARRQLWDALSAVRENGQCIIITSHSMEECEALCTRLAIMVNGQFQCLGSPQHLKNRFGSGYTVTARVGVTDVNRFRRFMTETFAECVLKEEHQGLLTFQVDGVSWAFVFESMEKSRSLMNVEDYSVSQTTLEQVFLMFARQQREDPRAKALE